MLLRILPSRQKKFERGAITVMAAVMAAFLPVPIGGVRIAAAPLQVVTTTTDLAYFAQRVGEDRVRATSLLKGNQDPHYFDPRPDFILRISRADLFAEIGLDLESAWTPPLLQQSRNEKIRKGGPGYCDASVDVRILEKPGGGVSRSMGDIHAFGNPHYWTDPLNALIAARNIRDTLTRVDPEGREAYDQNFRRFAQDLKRLTEEEIALFRPYRGLRVAVYHNEFGYLANRFGFEIAISIEEKPGVPPSANYLHDLIETIRRENIQIILISPFNDPRYARAVSAKTGAKIIIMPVSTGSEPEIKSYEDSIRTMLRRIREAAKSK